MTSQKDTLFIRLMCNCQRLVLGFTFRHIVCGLRWILK